MPTFESGTKKPKNIVLALCLVWIAFLVGQVSFADDKLTDILHVSGHPHQRISQQVASR